MCDMYEGKFEPNPDPLYGAEPLKGVTLGDFREDLPPMPKVGRRARVVECESIPFDDLLRTPAYFRGGLDYHEGRTAPPAAGDVHHCCAWWAGWLEARTQVRLGAILAKYKM